MARARELFPRPSHFSQDFIMDNLGFSHQFVPATQAGRRPLLLLHGTGGDENDLIPLGRQLAPGAALLSPRGKVLENGMPRFFRRLAEGVFDIEDLTARAAELAEFLERAGKHYGIETPIAVGFSNGANIAAALLLMHPATLAGAVLMRAMLPLRPATPPDLHAKPVLLLSGATDPLVPQAARDELAAELMAAGADVKYDIVSGGHNLTQHDLASAAAWLEQHR
jgi:phospholipase/carboxylesterase